MSEKKNQTIWYEMSVNQVGIFLMFILDGLTVARTEVCPQKATKKH